MAFKTWLFSVATLLVTIGSFGQNLPYTTHTDVGILTYTSPFFQGTTFTGRTFHGVRLKQHWQLGLSAGVDKYTSFWVLPLSTSAKYLLRPEAANSLYAGVDVGYGFPWLNKKTLDEQSFSGGFIAQPTVGLRIGEKGKGGFTISVSYQRQGFASLIEFQNNRIDDTYTFHRMALRCGMMF